MTRWHAIHVYHYDEDKTDLLLDGVRPWLRQVQPFADRWYFQQHWLRGPHVRLCLAATDADFHRVIVPSARETLGSYLRRHPSTTVLDPQRLLPLYRHLARAERVPGPLLPLQPDNTVVCRPYDARADALGSEELAHVVEQFYVDSDDLAFEMLESVRSGVDRRMLAFQLMVAAAHHLSHHVCYGFVSYRSHAEAFIAGSADPPALRRFLDDQYRARADDLARELVRIVDEPDDGVRAFVTLLRGIRDQVRPALDTGRLPLPGAPDDPRMGRIAGHSEFHRALTAETDTRHRLYGDPAFQANRLAVNLLYLHLARIGVRPLERYVLSHAIANTVERVYGLTAIDAVRLGVRQPERRSA